MQDDTNQTPSARSTRPGVKIALVAAGLAAGAIGATAFGASATTAGSGSTGSATSAYGSAPSTAPSGAPGSAGDHAGRGPGGPGGQNPNETVISDATLKAKLTAAAKAAVPGASVDKVETDSGDAKYEVHMTKADGSRVTVKFDANGNRTAVEDGMGK